MAAEDLGFKPPTFRVCLGGGLYASVVPNLHMQKTAAGILLGVVLFVTIVIGVLVVKGHRAAAPPPDIVPAQSDQQIREIHLQEDGKTGYRWSLDAEQADLDLSFGSCGRQPSLQGSPMGDAVTPQCLPQGGVFG